MPDETPHFLRVARAIALVGSVTVAGCSSTVAGQDVPAADQGGDLGAGSDTPPPPGIVVAPDAPADQPVMIDAGVIVSPDGPPPGIADAPTPPDASDDADGGVIFRPDGPLPGVVVAPDAPAFGALEPDGREDGVA